MLSSSLTYGVPMRVASDPVNLSDEQSRLVCPTSCALIRRRTVLS
jgi:hypothetical protein